MKKILLDTLKKYKNHPDFLGEEIINVNQKGGFDDSILHIASRQGNIEDIKILISHNADIDIIGDMGNTPLHYASLTNQKEVVKLLLNHNANTKIKNEFGQTALDISKIEKNQEIINLIRKGKR